MTVIRPNSIAGISSIFALGDQVQFLKADGMPAGVSIAGTVTFDDVTNVDSIGIVTARAGVNVGNPEINATILPNGDANFLGSVGIGTALPTSKLEVHRGTITLNATTSSDTTKLRWNYQGTEYQYIERDNANGGLAFGDNISEQMRIDSSGRLLVGVQTSFGFNNPLQVKGVAIAIQRDNSDNPENSPALNLHRTRGGIVADNDRLGMINFLGDDGNDLNTVGARIYAEVDGTPGTDDMPSRLVFSTTADGASSPTPRMTIDSVGALTFSGNSSSSWKLNAASDANAYSEIDGHFPTSNRTLFFNTNTANNSYAVWNRNSGSSGKGFGLEGQNFKVVQGSTEQMRIDSSGNVGIRTTLAEADLHVKRYFGSGSGEVVLRLDSGAALVSGRNEIRSGVTNGTNPYLSFAVRETGSPFDIIERMRIDSSGNVGIGTDAPSAKLTTQDDSLTSTTPGTNIVARFQTNGSGRDASILLGDAVATASRIGQTSGNITFHPGSATEKVRIDSTGRLLVGPTSARSNFFASVTSLVQVEGNNTPTSTISVVRNSNDNDGPTFLLGRSRSTGNTIVQDDDRIGRIEFQANDGTNFLSSASIQAYVDGAPGAGDMPTRLVFSTTADGLSSPTERMRIGHTGNVLFYNTTDYVAPFTDNAVTSGASGRRWSEVWAANGTIQTSDERLKTEIANSSLATDFIKSLRPVSYKWIEGGKRHTGEYDEDNNFVYETVAGARTHWGFIAQEVKQSADNAGVDFGGWVLEDKDDAESTQSLRYDQFIAPLTAALQEAIAKIETLEAEVAALKAA